MQKLNIFLLSQILLLVFLFLIPSMAADPSSVYIVYTEKPDALMEAKDHHIKTLSSVIGSEEAAKDALVYVYTNAATGFSAKLTPTQVEELSKQPGVLQVVKSQTLQLHDGGGRGIGRMHV